MTSIYFGEEHESFRRSVRQFLEGEVAPRAREWEEARRIPRDVFRRMGDLGFLGVLAPEELGGADGSVFHAIALLEELPRSRMGGFVAAVSVQQFIATGAIALHGTEEQKHRWLAPSVAGTKVGAIAISEPDTGSDVAAIRTTARRDGDAWVIDGAKTWITNGVEGDFVVVACRTAADAGAGGISLLVVEADTPGFSRSRLRKMGWHCSDTAELTFTDVRVPLGNLIGAENEGFFLIMETFVLERLVTAATSVGSARLALEETRKYVLSREAFGKPIGKFQAIRHRLADLHAELEAAAQLVYHAAWLHERGENPVAEACMAKLLATELSKRTADECLQFFGGYGTVEEYPMERFFRDARFGTIVAGTSEIMREVIAKSAIDGVTFPGRAERRDAQAEAGAEGAPAGGDSEADADTDAFAGDLVPDLFVADVTETLDAVLAEVPPPPAGSDPGRAAAEVPSPASPEPPAPAVEATVPSFVPPPPAPPPADVEVTEPAYFPEPSAPPSPARPTPEIGSTSIAMKLPVPRGVEELFETLPLRFRSDRAQGWNARFHFRFRDAARSDWTVVVEDGFCRTVEGHEGTPDCVVTTTEKTYLAIESGQQSPETAFLLGKVKVSNVAAMTRFGKLFRKVAP
ncbi:MAG TPA: acyl-CoA dehydrogenase family protein [Thermoanaerobaculia bacterium]|nr:acyl-CoA dehydrogenase family protein [Thermoanaerobaculia bacterium]